MDPKLILLSIIFFMGGLPVAMAARPSPRRTLRIIQILTLIAVFAWAIWCRRWYPQLVPVEY